MTEKSCKEWNIDAPWGKIAMVAWGNPAKPPILMVHGYMDSAATFIPLVELLPDTYYYVGIDLPGHGKSDPFPPGPLLSHAHIVEVIRLAVQSTGWANFVCMLHSAAFIYVNFYNAVFPGKITKLINLDPGYSLAMNYYSTHHLDFLMWKLHNKYYDNYKSYYSEPQEFPYDLVVKMTAKMRKLTKKKAEVVLSRSVVFTGDGKCRLTLDPRVKSLSGVAIPEETQLNIIIAHAPPMLNVTASDVYYRGRTYDHFITQMLKKIQSLPQCSVVTVQGAHDVHVSNPELLVPHIVDFLNRDFTDAKAKL